MTGLGQRRTCRPQIAMSVLPLKQTSHGAISMSAKGKPDMTRSNRDVRFTPESGHPSAPPPCQLCARSGHSSVRFVIFIPSDADYDGRRADWIFERKKLKPRGDYV
jgi:hypothetical protein